MDNVDDRSMTGAIYSVEFVEPDEGDDDRKPGTYLTIRVDDPRLSFGAGRVEIRYIRSRSQTQEG